jgi:2-isopropylmalate synthase
MTVVVVYDTTLRDGMQGEGMSLSVEEKVRVARILDELGVPMIEAGFPTSNPKELELFDRLREAGLAADVCAFGMTRRRGVEAAEDDGLRVLAESWTPVSTIVGKTWGLHLEKVVRVGRDENLAMIAESVAFLVAAGKRVIYDAEHFFDGYRDDPAYAIACLRAALESGAENLTICATPTARRCRTRSPRRCTSCGAPCRTPRSASTPTTTPSARSRTRSPGSPRAPCSSRAP